MIEYYKEYNHFKKIEDVTMDILIDMISPFKKLNAYKANSLIHLQIKYCKERDEKLRKEKLEIEINANNEINRI